MAPFATTTLRLLRRRELLRRIDSKFLLTPAQLSRVMSQIPHAYEVVRTADRSRSPYETLYVDTPELRCFHDHRRGRRPRHKVRFRHYPDRDLSYLEVKTKRNEYTTFKYRRPIEFGQSELNGDAFDFIAGHCDLPARKLRPQVWTNFFRSTLVGIRTEERITIDTRLEMVRDERLIALDGVVILEVKQGHFDARSPIMLALRACGLKMVSASKYCTANVLHDRDLRFNRLKPAIRTVERLSTGRREATAATRSGLAAASAG